MWLSFLAGTGRWLLRRWKPVLLVISVALCVTLVFLYVRGAENAKGRLLVMEQRLAAAEAATAQNSAELEKCLALNQANAREAQLQADRARAAAERVRDLERAANRRVTEVDREADALRAGGLDCPAINADFRGWMRDDP